MDMAVSESEKETTNETATEQAEPENSQENDTSQDQDLAAKLDYWKKRSRQNEAKAKANAEKAKKFDELEAQNMSDLEKTQKQLEDVLAENKNLKLDKARNRIGKENHVDPDLLRGATVEELEEHAAQLAEYLNAKTEPKSSADIAGNQGKPINVDQLSRDQIKNMTSKEIVEAQKNGRLDAALGVKTK